MTNRRLLPWVIVATVVVCVVTSAVVVGAEGLWGALIGGVVVVVFLGSTRTVLGPVATATPTLSLLFAMIFFLTKVVALFVLFLVLSRSAGDSGPIDPESVSVTVIVTTLAWLVVRIVDSSRERIPTYDLGDPDEGRSDGSSPG